MPATDHATISTVQTDEEMATEHRAATPQTKQYNINSAHTLTASVCLKAYRTWSKHCNLVPISSYSLLQLQVWPLPITRKGRSKLTQLSNQCMGFKFSKMKCKVQVPTKEPDQPHRRHLQQVAPLKIKDSCHINNRVPTEPTIGDAPWNYCETLERGVVFPKTITCQ